MFRATRCRAVELALPADVEDNLAVRELQDSVDGFGNAGTRVLADDDAVHDDEKFLRDNFAFGFGEVGQRIDYAVGDRAGKSLRQEHCRKLIEACTIGGEGGKKLQLAPLR